MVMGLAGPACSGPRAPPPATGPDVSLLTRGEDAYRRAEFDSARGFWRAALPEAERTSDTADQAKLLTWLGLAAWKEGEYAEARALGEQALALKLQSSIDVELWRSYNALGLLAHDEGRLNDALLHYHDAGKATGAGPDTVAVATVALNTARVYHDLGEFAQARAGFVSARDAFHGLGDAREGRVLINLGMLEVQMGDPLAAIRALAAARRLARASGDRDAEQNALGQLGTAYDALGEPRLAFAALDSALAMAREQGLRQEEASNLELIAGLLRDSGNLQRALELYAEAAIINAELGLTMDQGANLRRAAEIQAAIGRPDLARANTLAALDIQRSTGARFQELRDLVFLADLASTTKEPTTVVEGHLRTAERLSMALDTRGARVEVALARATIADRAGDSRRVLRGLGRAREDLARGGFGGEWQASVLRARAYGRLARLDSAAREGRAAVAAVERVRGGFGSPMLRSSFVAEKSEAYGDLVDILLRLDRTSEAFEVADGARSHALLEHLAAAGDDGRSDGKAVRALAEGETLLRRINILVARLDSAEQTPRSERADTAEGLFDSLAAQVVEARSDYEALLSTADERDGMGAAFLGGRGARVGEVQRVLGNDEAILEYLVSAEHLVMFLVTTTDVRSVVAGMAREDLARRVRLARDLLGDRSSLPAQSAAVLSSLHSVLIAPLERTGLLRGVRRLILVPHSVLTYLPFAALRSEGTGRRLVEDYMLLYLPSASALGVLRRSSPLQSNGGRIESGAAFAPFPETLPGSVREVRTVAREVGAQLQTGRLATERRVRTALAAGGMVHIASHGIMNQRNPMFSRIELAPGRGKPDDDGRLEVHELLSLRIGASLVFLSGCETGVGASWSTQFSRGEDFATLGQAFLYAGARNVVATLWQIEDSGAAAFAERFYANLKTMAPDEALATTQRNMLEGSRYSGPYHWAGYQVIGLGELSAGPHTAGGMSVQRR